MGGYIGATAVGLVTTAADVQGDITSTDTTPEVILKNTTETDADGSRDGKITFKGEQSGGEESTLAQIQSSHDGTADDQKGDLIFKTNDGSDGASPTERLKIDSTGNVGVSGSTKTTALSSAAHFDTLGLTVDDNTAYDNVGIGGGIAFRGKRNSSGTQTVFGAIDVGKESAANDSYTGSLRFYTNNNSTGIPTEHMLLHSTGTLQIGSSTNAGYGPLQIGSTSLASPIMQFLSTTTGNNTIHFGDATSGAGRYSGYLNYRHNGNSFEIATNGAERMRIDSSGNFLLGTTVNRSGNSSITLEAGNSFLMMRASGTSGLSQVSFMRNTAATPVQVGSIVTTGSATTYATSSDYRLKENVADISDGITRIKQLAPKRFNFIVDPDTTVDGFIAHEAATVVPEAVTGTHDGMRDEEYEVTPAVLDDDGNVVTEAVMGTRSVPDHQGIDQAKLVPLLTAALQEAIAKIETLETQNTTQATQIADLITRVETLEGA